MSAIDPTCLPWQTAHDFDIEGATTIIGNVDGEIIDGTTHHTYDFVARTLDVEDDSQSHSVAVANAAFIVRACSSHAALVEALESVTGLLRDERDSLFECSTVGDDPETLDEDARPYIAQMDVALAASRAALAKARGPEDRGRAVPDHASGPTIMHPEGYSE